MLHARKILAAFLVAALATVSLAGCKGSGGTSENSTTKGTPEKITWYQVGTAPAALDRINKAASKYLQSKGLNVELDLQILTWSNYSTQLSTMVAAKEEFDLIGCAGGTARSYARSGAFVELTDKLLSKDAPETVKAIGKDILEVSKVDGKLYNLPVNKDTAEAMGYLYNKNIADKYGLTDACAKVKSLDDWTPIFQKLHAADPSIICYLTGGNDMMNACNAIYVSALSMPGIVFANNDASNKTIINQWESPKVVNYLKTIRSWYQAGYLNKDSTTDTTAAKNNNKVFVYTDQLKPGKAAEVTTDTVKWDQVQTSDVFRGIKDVLGWTSAVSVTSHDQDLALKVLNMDYKDKTFNNMLLYGEEGTDYTLSGEVVTQVKGGYDFSGTAWEFGNQFLNYLKTGEASDKWAKMKAFNDGATTLDCAGFGFNDTEYSTEITALANVSGEYSTLLIAGSVDVDKYLTEFNTKLKSNGMQKVLDAENKQYAAFLASKKK